MRVRWCRLLIQSCASSELVYELPLKEEQNAAQETATESDKKALVFCDLVTNVTEGPLNVRILGIVTGGNNPIVPWMPRYLDTLTLSNIFDCLHTAHAPLHTIIKF